jgi:nucleoid-associated protein YgaU
MRRLAGVLLLLLAASGARAEERLHVVQPGESLASIAEQELGDKMLWPLVYKANRDRIKDPARIYPGQELTIPAPGDGARGVTPAPEKDPEDDE